jgi:hypothetical protein
VPRLVAFPSQGVAFGGQDGHLLESFVSLVDQFD